MPDAWTTPWLSVNSRDLFEPCSLGVGQPGAELLQGWFAVRAHAVALTLEEQLAAVDDVGEGAQLRERVGASGWAGR
jgi:hypothetical protein